MVSEWRGHREGNKSYLSDGRIENPNVLVTVWLNEWWPKLKFLVEAFVWNLCLDHISLPLKDHYQIKFISEQMHSLLLFPQLTNLSVSYNFKKKMKKKKDAVLSCFN